MTAAILLATPALAQQALEEIVISATRTPAEINKVGSTVEVIERDELEKQQQTFLKDYLERLPGVTFGQNGPPGSVPAIQMRGALGQYVKVLIDGMDVSDVAAPQAAASFEHLTVGDIERIEVLKGPQSTLYGSEAVGGVIAITTRGPERGLSVSANAEGGSYETKRGSATVAYGGERGDISVTAQGIDTAGFSAADEDAGNPERDGYENVTFSGRAQYKVSDNLRLFFAARSTEANVDLDAFSFITGLPIDAIGERSTFDLKAVRGGAELTLFDGRFVNTVSAQRTIIDRENFGLFPATFQSERTKYEYQGVARFSSAISLVVGADRDETSAVTSSSGGAADTNGIFAQALVEPVENLNLTAGVRRDDHSAFGTFDTWRVTGAYFIPETGTKFRASYGTAFRAPSLFELFDPTFGNTGLDPEESAGWDAGIDQTFANGDYRFSATYFALDIDNLIVFTFPAGYANVTDRTERRGVELSARAQFTPWLAASAAYTYTNAEDATGARIIRVPRHVVSLGLDIEPIEKLSVSTTMHIVRDTVDVQFPNVVALDDYVLWNAKVSYDITDRLQAYVRGVNLLNQEYQTINGFGTSDLAVYAGLTMKLSGPVSDDVTLR